MEKDKENTLTIKEIAELFNVPESILCKMQIPTPHEWPEIKARAQERIDEFAIQFLLFYMENIEQEK